jgi:hypothetical protein
MLEKIDKRAPKPQAVPQPPSIMGRVQAKGKHVSKAALETAIQKIALQSITAMEDVDPQVVVRLIQYFEKKP